MGISGDPNLKMNLLYIGPYQAGSTSRMRGEVLKSLCPVMHFYVVDTSVPFNAGNKLLRSIAFRFKRGPLISQINCYIIQTIAAIPASFFDLIWIDKAIFITSKTTQFLRSLTNKLVHYTPDMAFLGNQSHHFKKSIPFFNTAFAYGLFIIQDSFLQPSSNY